MAGRPTGATGSASEHRLDSLISREGVFLLQNLVLVALAAVVFWLTFFPLISEAITGTQTSVGPPVFARFVVPLALDRRGALRDRADHRLAARDAGQAQAQLRLPGGGRAGRRSCVLAFVSGVTEHVFAYLMFGFGAFVVATVAQEFFRGARARRAMTGESPGGALVALVRRNRRRYGGYIVHAGVAVALVGVAGSTSFQHQRYATLAPGPERAPRRLHAHVRAPDGQRDRAEDLLRRRARREQGRAPGDDPAHQLRPVPVA